MKHQNFTYNKNDSKIISIFSVLDAWCDDLELLSAAERAGRLNLLTAIIAINDALLAGTVATVDHAENLKDDFFGAIAVQDHIHKLLENHDAFSTVVDSAQLRTHLREQLFEILRILDEPARFIFEADGVSTGSAEMIESLIAVYWQILFSKQERLVCQE